MYTQFYGFSKKPFDVTSNPEFLFLSASHREALASLIYGVQERRGILVLTGEVGTGKTTLLKAAMAELADSTRFAFIFYTRADFAEQLTMAAGELDIIDPGTSPSEAALVSRLKAFAGDRAAEGQNVAILVDEAQHLDHQTLEKYRLLSNLESESGKLVQIVFSGQPELEKKLTDHRLRQLVQRINLRRSLPPLSKAETFGYITHRLENAGGGGVFDDDSMDLIWDYARGIPRQINMLCDNALLIGYGLDKRLITADVVQEAVDDLTWGPDGGEEGDPEEEDDADRDLGGKIRPFCP